jgi:deoxyribose-phosphate aldolase
VNVALCRELLADSEVKLCSVVGFPLGSSSSYIKAKETEKAVEDGAVEIDMVMNVGAHRDKRYDFVLEDVKSVVKASGDSLVKVILETCYLMDDEIVKACELVMEAGADFVKTSTGFGAFGAFPDHIRLMRQTVGPDFGVKASGGIKNFKDTWRLIKAGANRIGTSAGIVILEGAELYKFAPDAWLEPEIPCHNCPSRHALLGKLPKAVYTYYKNKCSECEYRDQYNKFYE